MSAPPPRPDIVCLLPARNAAGDLPGWFESVGRFADAVIALDDGSTDDTRSILEAHPLVHRVLTNPPRPSYVGWDDAENRNRLLEAAGELNPRWVMQLDADERLPADDAAALVQFVHEDADPAKGYLFRVFRMIDDIEHYDLVSPFIGRLFAYQPGQRFPDVRLHFVALPISIPRTDYVPTTLRIQHLSSLTEERRQERFQKYEEVDPDNVYQDSYAHIVKPPREVRPWFPRSEHLPVVYRGRKKTPAAPGMAMSAVVISHNDAALIEDAVRSVVTQECDEPFEVIVVTSGDDGSGDVVRRAFPHVKLVELPGRALPGRARNAGLALASGQYVTFPGSHIRLGPGSLAARLRAHRNGWPMVVGTVINGTPTMAGWASYFLDHSAHLRGSPAEPMVDPPGACSYLRDLLDEVGGFREDLRAGEDTAVNLTLFRRGYGAFREPAAVMTHISPVRTAGRLVRHHFQRGRGLVQVAFTQRYVNKRMPIGFRHYMIGGVPRRLRAVRTRVKLYDPELLGRLWRVSPLVVVGAVSAWVGACFQVALDIYRDRPVSSQRRR